MRLTGREEGTDTGGENLPASKGTRVRERPNDASHLFSETRTNRRQIDPEAHYAHLRSQVVSAMDTGREQFQLGEEGQLDLAALVLKHRYPGFEPWEPRPYAEWLLRRRPTR